MHDVYQTTIYVCITSVRFPSIGPVCVSLYYWHYTGNRHHSAYNVPYLVNPTCGSCGSTRHYSGQPAPLNGRY